MRLLPETSFLFRNQEEEYGLDFVDSKNNIEAVEEFFYKFIGSLKTGIASLSCTGNRSPQGASQAHYNSQGNIIAFLLLTSFSELSQVWNMAATETQLMSSVALIGKCSLSCFFPLRKTMFNLQIVTH